MVQCKQQKHQNNVNDMSSFLILKKSMLNVFIVDFEYVCAVKVFQ